MKILIAEDSLGMRKIVTSMLKGFGYDDLLLATDGAEALQTAVALRRLDLLLTNWDMPLMDGLTLTAKLRNIPRYADLPILLFTSRHSAQDVIAGSKAGIDGYLRKPFTPGQLREQLERVLERRSRDRVSSIARALDPLKHGDTHPLVVVGDRAGSVVELLKPNNVDVVDFLAETVNGLDALNSRLKDMHVGLVLASSSTEAGRRAKELGDRVKTMIVSTGIAGGGITLARLISINKRPDLSVFLVCEDRDKIPQQVRAGLDHLGVIAVERNLIDAEAMQSLLTEHVAAVAYEGPPSELPSPEEIRQRLAMDVSLTVNLPVLPEVYHHIVVLSHDASSDIRDWIEPIESDPLSSAQIIRRAHSPLYGFHGQIDETDRAVILLGKETVVEVIMSEAVRRSFEGIEETEFSIEEYWSHSVTVALVARLLALPPGEDQRTPQQQTEFDAFELTEEACRALESCNFGVRWPLSVHQNPFVGGIVHDIGKVALAHSYPGLFAQILEELENHSWRQSMRTAEETCAGVNHCQAGGILAETWKLGEDVGRVVERHHEPDVDDNYTRLVAVADFLGAGICPFPARAVYPMVPLISAGVTPSDEDLAASERFLFGSALPPDLGVDMKDLIALGQHLAPLVRKRTAELKESI